MIRIVCFGDSNTYGFNPQTGGRYDESIRWPMRLQELLGNEYEVIEEGQNGRTIACDDPWEGGTKCGMDYVLPMLETKRPDLLIIMLGSNDLKAKFALPAADIAGSLITMIMKIKGHCEHYLGCPDMKILIVAPPALSEPFKESCFSIFFDIDTAVDKSKELAKWYELVAKQHGCYFLNATESVSAGMIDHLHLAPEGHAKMAELVKDSIVQIFGN
ncbi:MAG: acylhydrolase [Lachnospiraceae bacterium]|nr:acylhydrolase [Lachnospiraceae bacterium]